MNLEQRLPLSSCLVCFRRWFRFWQRYSISLSQQRDRFWEGDAFQVLDETDGIALGPATEAVVVSWALANMKRRRLLLVKGTESDKAGAGFSQAHITLNDMDDVDAGLQLLDKLFAKVHSVPHRIHLVEDESMDQAFRETTVTAFPPCPLSAA